MRRRHTILTAEERARLLAAPTLTHSELAHVLGVGPTNLRDALRRGEIELPALRIGSRVTYPAVPVRRLLGMETATEVELDGGAAA